MNAQKIYNYFILWKLLHWKYLKYLHLYMIFILPKHKMSNLFLNDIAQSNKKGKLHLTHNAEIKVSE